MFIDNVVRKKFEGSEKYDKFAIASTMFAVSFEGASCSLIESKVLNNCQSCNLKFLCKRLEEVVEDYTDETTVITDSFSFEK